MRYTVELSGKELELELTGGEMIAHGGRRRRAELVPRSGDAYSLLLERKVIELAIHGEGGRYRVGFGGWDWEVRVAPSQVRELRRLFPRDERGWERAREAIVAHLPGLVVELKVAEGQAVQEGQGLMVIEAMKMENEIRAPCAGSVEQVGVRKGEEIQRGQLLCYIRR